MQIGMIGLGRMGAIMVKRLLKGGGHQCVIYDSPTCLLSCEKGAL
jgi:6-phosphogluconate dehydrogenase